MDRASVVHTEAVVFSVEAKMDNDIAVFLIERKTTP